MISKLTSKNIETISLDLKQKIVHNHIANISIINSTDLLCTFSLCRKERLIISLSHQNPFIALVDILINVPTTLGQFNDVIRKEVKDGFILDVNAIKDDRIINIDYEITDDYFIKHRRTLVLELIPHRPNLMILDENQNIIYASHYSSLTANRIVLKGFKYQPLPINNKKIEDGDFDYLQFKQEVKDYFYQAKTKRLEEQFKPLITSMKIRIKSLKQKLNKLDKENELAEQRFIYKEIADTLLAYQYDKDLLLEYIKEKDIKYDQSISIGNNANYYYKWYKKAKRTLQMNEIERQKSLFEIAKYEDLLNKIPYMNEDDLLELSEELMVKKLLSNKKKKKVNNISFIQIDNTKIYYGKNAKQNNEITFSIAHKDDYYFHIKDYHGSHVVIKNNNPNDELKLIAAEIALLLSGKESGEVLFTQNKYVKKGSSLGEAILQKYQSIYINKVREETKKKLIAN